MRKIVIHKPGGHDRLLIEEQPTPAPGPGEVLLEVEAIGVNYAEPESGRTVGKLVLTV